MFNKRRIRGFGMSMFILFLLLGIRLYYIQVVKAPIYSELAMQQRSTQIPLSSNRGTIYDRNLIPLTNGRTIEVVVIPKDIIINDKEIYKQIKNSTPLRAKELDDKIKSSNKLLQIPIDKKFDLGKYEKQIFFTEIVERYDEDNTLSHVIGYANKLDNTGKAGIEKVYDEFLNSNNKKSLILEYDSGRNIILNAVEYVDETDDPNNPAGVKLTIDSQIQNAVEDIMDEKEINGAVVVSEVETGNIVSLASRPNFNQEKIGEYLNNEEMALYNKTIQVGYPPGSIFKIVVLIAALESDINIVDQEFYCNGYEDVNNVRISCNGNHGSIDLEKAFTISCNSTFIQLGKEVGAAKIIELAKRLNFGEKINIGLLEEIEGNLPEGDELKGPSVGNISIGQGKIETTPLQISNLLMTVANGGIEKHLTVVEGITNSDGLVLKSYNREVDKRIISEEVSEILYDYLVNVVERGTGRNIDLEEIGGAGGKTGSAEAILYNKETIHGWFAGFFPKKNPQYVITVLIEEGYSGSRSASPIFEQVAKKINKIYPVY